MLLQPAQHIEYVQQKSHWPVPGVYQHYKGQLYKVVAVARHSETLQEMIIYQALYGDYEFWVRPLDMFCEQVEIEGVLMPRFKLLKSNA